MDVEELTRIVRGAFKIASKGDGHWSSENQGPVAAVLVGIALQNVSGDAIKNALLQVDTE